MEVHSDYAAVSAVLEARGEKRESESKVGIGADAQAEIM